MKNPCIYTLKDGTKLNYEQMRQYLFDNYADVVTGLPPAMPPPMGEGEGKRSNKAMLNRLYESDYIYDSAKEKFQEVGLKYEPQSKDEARRLAEGIVRTFGIDEAVALAEARRFGGGVNSSIFAQSLDILFGQEDATADPATKRVIQETWADIAVRYDEWARGLGRDIAQIDDFYRKSPVGVVLAINKLNQNDFKQWFEQNKKPYGEVFDYLKTDPEFLKLVNIGQQSPSKAERAANRLKRRGKIVEAFDKMKVKKGMTFGTVIPPQVWNAAVEAMKQATLAGESMVNVIEIGAEYIRNKVGSFDESKFKEHVESQLNQANEAEKILDRIRKKLPGLTETQKRDFVRKMAKRIIENGGLAYTEFQDLLAEARGRGPLTEENIKKVEGLVKQVNAVDDFADKAIAEKTPENLNNYNNALEKAQDAAMELNDWFPEQTDVVRTIQSIAQLSTLTGVSLVKNVSYNMWWHAGPRFATAIQMSILDHAISGAGRIFGRNIPVTYTIMNVQKQYFKQMMKSGGLSLRQVVTGLTQRDYYKKEIFISHLKPYDAAKDLLSAFKGEIKLAPIEITDRLIKSTFGVPAVISARLLNVGDKGFREAAEAAQAVREAVNRFKLTGLDKQLFIAFPDRMAKQLFMKEGMSEEQAAAEAEALDKRIVREGEEAVFQQANLVDDFMKNISKWFNDKKEIPKAANAVRRLASTLSMPFLKTPINLGIHFMALTNWEVSVTFALINARSAYIKRKAGDPTWRNDTLQAKKWLATAGTGLGIMAMWGWMTGIGAISGGGEKEEKEKERSVEKLYRQPRSINVTKVERVLTGGTSEDQDGDMSVDVSWFGSIGMALANYQNIRDLQRDDPEVRTYLDNLGSSLSFSAYEALEKGVFSSQAALTQAILDRNNSFFEQYLTSLFNVGLNVIQPGTFAQIERARVPYEYQLKADSFMERLDNVLKARNTYWYADLKKEFPPEAITIWGDVANREDPWLYRVFGTSKIKKDAFAYSLYEMYDKTGNLKLFPAHPSSRLTHEGQDVKLTVKQHDALKRMVGSERRKIAEAFLNGMGSISKWDKEKNKLVSYKFTDIVAQFNKAKNDTERAVAIVELTSKMQDIYRAGYEQGKKNFMADPEFVSLFPTVENEQKQRMKLQQKANTRDLKKMMKNMAAPNEADETDYEQESD